MMQESRFSGIKPLNGTDTGKVTSQKSAKPNSRKKTRFDCCKNQIFYEICRWLPSIAEEEITTTQLILVQAQNKSKQSEQNFALKQTWKI